MTLAFAEVKGSDDRARRHELFEDAFPETRGTSVASADHYEWKFHGFPATPPSYEYCARDGDRMVGYYGAVPFRYMIAGRPMTAGMVCDVMTHSAARGKGVFTDLGRFATAQLETSELDFLTGYPVRPEVMGGHLRVGWKVAFELPMYLRPLRSDAIVASRGIPWVAPVTNVGVGAFRRALAPRPRSGAYEAVVGSPHDFAALPQFLEFVSRWEGQVKNHLVKSGEFYRWRLGAPGVEYRMFLVLHKERVVAAAVARNVTLHGIPSLALLDVMTLEDHREALPRLYGQIDREAQACQSQAIVTMMSRVSARAHRLRRFGFLRSPFTFKLILRSVNNAVSVEQLSREDDWHLMWIDSDDL